MNEAETKMAATIDLKGVRNLRMVDHRKVYLGAPFFNEEQKRLCETLEGCFTRRGHPFCSPRNDVGIVTPENAREIFAGNLAAMDECGVLLAVLDYRLPSHQELVIKDSKRNAHIRMAVPDTGVLVEVGYMAAQRKPVVLYTEQPMGSINVMLLCSAVGVIHQPAQLANFLTPIEPGALFNWAALSVHTSQKVY